MADADPKTRIALKRLRVAAAFIDFIIYSVVAVTIGIFFIEKQTFNGASGSGYRIGFTITLFPVLVGLLIWLLLFPILEGATGQTIGKKLLKLKVVKEDFSPPAIGTSFIRHFFDVIDFLFLAGLVVVATNARKQRIGDLVAKTLVVST